jgi:hypothetical protein
MSRTVCAKHNHQAAIIARGFCECDAARSPVSVSPPPTLARVGLADFPETPDAFDTELAQAYEALNKVLPMFERSQAALADPQTGWRAREYAQRYVDENCEAVATAETKIGEMNAEFSARGGWRRYFMVNNKGGHLHTSMACSTCFPTTSYSWTPAMSGKDDGQVVEEFGPEVCTACIPSAPVSPFYSNGQSGREKLSAQAEAEKKALKAEREEAKHQKFLKNQIVIPDSEVVWDHNHKGWHPASIKTLTEARSELDHASWAYPHRRDRALDLSQGADQNGFDARDAEYQRNNLRVLCQAVGAKLGKEPRAVLAAYLKKNDVTSVTFEEIFGA